MPVWVGHENTDPEIEDYVPSHPSRGTGTLQLGLEGGGRKGGREGGREERGEGEKEGEREGGRETKEGEREGGGREEDPCSEVKGDYFPLNILSQIRYPPPTYMYTCTCKQTVNTHLQKGGHFPEYEWCGC